MRRVLGERRRRREAGPSRKADRRLSQVRKGVMRRVAQRVTEVSDPLRVFHPPLDDRAEGHRELAGEPEVHEASTLRVADRPPPLLSLLLLPLSPLRRLAGCLFGIALPPLRCGGLWTCILLVDIGVGGYATGGRSRHLAHASLLRRRTSRLLVRVALQIAVVLVSRLALPLRHAGSW